MGTLVNVGGKVVPMPNAHFNVKKTFGEFAVLLDEKKKHVPLDKEGFPLVELCGETVYEVQLMGEEQVKEEIAKHKLKIMEANSPEQLATTKKKKKKKKKENAKKSMRSERREARKMEKLAAGFVGDDSDVQVDCSCCSFGKLFKRKSTDFQNSETKSPLLFEISENP
jgi:hypothetical protein